MYIICKTIEDNVVFVIKRKRIYHLVEFAILK